MRIEIFRLATHSDIEEITQLVNAAYRPHENTVGWTHEADLVSGHRINTKQLTDILSKPELVILVAIKDLSIVACVEIKKQGNVSYIDMLAVKPSLQGLGIGKELLNCSEHYARNHFNADKFMMWVLSPRTDLIAFYLRCGYQKSNVTANYPTFSNVGIPKQDGLTLEILEKSATLN